MLFVVVVVVFVVIVVAVLVVVVGVSELSRCHLKVILNVYKQST